MEERYQILFIGALLLLSVGILFALIRAIRGPRIADRIMGINLISTLSLSCLAILAILLNQSWLLDVCLIYGLLSFLTVVVLAKIHIASRGKEDTDD